MKMKTVQIILVPGVALTMFACFVAMFTGPYWMNPMRFGWPTWWFQLTLDRILNFGVPIAWVLFAVGLVLVRRDNTHRRQILWVVVMCCTTVLLVWFSHHVWQNWSDNPMQQPSLHDRIWWL